MHRSIKNFLIFSLLSIFLFSFPVSQSVSKTAESDAVISRPSGEHQDELTSSGPNNRPSTAKVTIQSRRDIIELLFGTIIAVIGLIAVVLAIFRWKANDLSLITFGVFCFIYGARTRAFQFLVDASPLFWAYWQWFLVYLTPVPAYMFFEQFIGKGWKSSVRRLWQIQLVFVIVAVLVGLILSAPWAAGIANNVIATVGLLVLGINLFGSDLQKTRELRVLKSGLVIFFITALTVNIAPLLRPGFEISELEAFGFLILLGCFVYVVAYRFFQNEKELITIAQELETARQIQSFILPQETVNIKGLYLAAHYVPMASVAGDFYDFLKVDEKRLGILVADVSGHGVPASLISSMVKIAFSSQLPRANNPARVLSGINQVLCGKLENDFVTAGYLFIDTANQVAKYAGAGHPPLIMWRGSDQKVYEYRGTGIILGQLEEAQYQNIELNLESGDRFFLYTDGIIEAANAAGDFFGRNHFKEFITSQANRSAGNMADGIIQHISNWSGKHLDEALDDDLTLVVADFIGS